jgi:hypothetical protein
VQSLETLSILDSLSMLRATYSVTTERQDGRHYSIAHVEDGIAKPLVNRLDRLG